MKGSVQLRTFLREIRAGSHISVAADRAGIPFPEAELHVEAERLGEYADIITDEPAPIVAHDTEGLSMAKRAKQNDGVTNLTETKEVIREAVSRILKLKTDRKDINAAIGEQRARVKKYGVPPAALDLALRMKEADVEDRQRHDEGYAIARDALGLGLQRSLFEMLDERQDAEAGTIANGALQKARAHLSPFPTR